MILPLPAPLPLARPLPLPRPLDLLEGSLELVEDVARSSLCSGARCVELLPAAVGDWARAASLPLESPVRSVLCPASDAGSELPWRLSVSALAVAVGAVDMAAGGQGPLAHRSSFMSASTAVRQGARRLRVAVSLLPWLERTVDCRAALVMQPPRRTFAASAQQWAAQPRLKTKSASASAIPDLSEIPASRIRNFAIIASRTLEL